MNTTAWISAVITVITAPADQPVPHTVYQAGQAAYQSQSVTRAGVQEELNSHLRNELRIMQGHTDSNHRRAQP